MILRAMALRGLVPYAIAAVLIAVGSSVAVVSTARPTSVGVAPAATGVPAATTPRAVPELSKTARLAYWRDSKLWISNLDGSLRRSVASTEDLRRISLTRWAVDGSAVAFVDSGLSLAIASSGRPRVDVDLPIELRNTGYRIADIRWAPDAARIAATLLRPGDGRSDAFLVELTAERPVWSRLTSLEDLFVGDWISNDELLASTAGGVVGVLGTRAPNTMRLISGVQGVSPIIGPEGRIHFLVGRIPTSRDPSLAYITANRASVWSAATDGSDVRRETTWELNDIRLDARLPDGRYLAHRGSSNSQGTVSEDIDLLPTNAGVMERVRIAPDGRSAYGFTPERIVRIELPKLSATPPATAAGAVTVFLDTSGEADVWFPSALSLARGGERVQGAAAAAAVFALGSHIWRLEGGVASLLRAAPILRRSFLPGPRWSPTGEHVLVVEQAGATVSSTTFVAHTVSRSGDAVRLTGSQGAARSYSWSPSGGEVAIVVDRRGVSGIGSDAQPEVRFFDPSGRATRTAVPGSEVAWTAKGILVLRDVAGAPALLRIQGENESKTIVTRERLAADPRATPSATTSATVSSLEAARDGSFASVRLQTQDSTASRTYFVLLSADGAPLQYVRGETLTDLAWSPTRPLLGYTLDIRTANERAVVASPATGLFAYPVAGGAPVRVGPGGAPLSVAPAR